MNDLQDDASDLLDVLDRLMTVLKPSCGGDRMIEIQRRRGSECWEDKNYFYVQADLADVPQSAVDICIIGNRVLIRMAH